MINHYLQHKDKIIYDQTDYLCNEREKICICNTNADLYRQIYARNNYDAEKKYISWIKKSKDKF
jgi:hypothetical protein